MSERTALPPIDFAALAAALLAQAGTLVPNWLPGGVQRGHEWVCSSLSGGTGTSLSVSLSNGRWADFATGESGGDLLGLYAAIHGLPMVRAALEVARSEGLQDVAGIVHKHAGDAAPVVPKAPRAAPVAVPAPRVDEGWATVVPVPQHAPAATFKHQYRAAADIEHTAAYRLNDALYGYVVRFKTSDGGKETLPYTWCTSARDGASRWHWRQWDEPRPLYFPSGVLPVFTGVLVEGERKADVLQAALDACAPGVYAVATWPGGCKAWKKADFSWLKNCNVLLWPDCDGKRAPLTKEDKLACVDAAALDASAALKPLLPVDKQPGMAAMLGIGALLRDVHGCTVQLLPIPEPLTVPDGWDCADAIEKDGWDGARLLAFFARAFALPSAKVVETKKIDGPAVAGTGDGGGGGGAGDALVKALPCWLAPYWDADKCRWLVSRKLVIAALEHDEELAPVLALNELSNTVEARKPWPWGGERGAGGGGIAGADDLLLGKFLTAKYGLPSLPRAALAEAIETVAHTRRFHPVRDYLHGLEHDGVTRIDKWLVWVLGEKPETLSQALYVYLCMVGRYWLLGMVYRVMEPGCKFDYCPVLEGAGGLRKSTFVEVLASSEYFSDAHFDLQRGKEGQEQVQGRWLYELAELATFGKAEINLIKSFISSKVDRYRPSYGRTVEAFARQCVLVGTTNENTYLRDRTGNRRFWPVPVKQPIKIDWLAKWRDQLFAEALLLYKEGARYTPTPEQEKQFFVPMQESRLVETAVLSELLNVLTRPPLASGIGEIVNCFANFVTISQLTQALGVDAAKSGPALEAQIRGWLDHEGWPRVKKMVNNVRAWGYERPRDWPKNEPEGDASSGFGPAAGDDGKILKEDADDEPF